MPPRYRHPHQHRHRHRHRHRHAQTQTQTLRYIASLFRRAPIARAPSLSHASPREPPQANEQGGERTCKRNNHQGFPSHRPRGPSGGAAPQLRVKNKPAPKASNSRLDAWSLVKIWMFNFVSSALLLCIWSYMKTCEVYPIAVPWICTINNAKPHAT